MCILGTRILLNYTLGYIRAETPRGGGMHCTLEVFLNSARPPCNFFFVWGLSGDDLGERAEMGGRGEEAVGVLEVEILKCESEWEGKHELGCYI